MFLISRQEYNHVNNHMKIKCENILNYFRLGTKYNKMAESILQNLKTDVIHRIDVNFKMKHKLLIFQIFQKL